MRILFLSHSDLEGGAAIAAHRLFDALLRRDNDVRMLVDRKAGNHPRVVRLLRHVSMLKGLHRIAIRRLLESRYPNRLPGAYSIGSLPDGTSRAIRELSPDILHLHWTGNGFVNPSHLRSLGKPIIWTLHDMMPFTGGCHYDSGCGRYTGSCGKCPQLGSVRAADLSSWELKRKASGIRPLSVTLVSPSRWLADSARRSSLFRHYDIRTIPYGIDLERFKPGSKDESRAILGLPNDSPLLFFGAFSGAIDPRKGFAELTTALESGLSAWTGRQPQLVVFGGSKGQCAVPNGYRVHSLGVLKGDDSLRTAYSAADAFIAPSQQDNLPNTIMESLACGTPVVSFKSGGIPEMVDHKVNGYLADTNDIHDLLRGMLWVLDKPDRLRELGREARRKAVAVYGDAMQAERYEKLYQEVCHCPVARSPVG